MTFDQDEPPTPLRRRTAIRAQLDTATAGRPPGPPAELRFHEAAQSSNSDLDVLMGYQIFLGRDPENSFVISDAKSSPVRGFVRGLLSSGEFQTAVATPLQRGQRLPHDRVGPSPGPEHIAWIAATLVVEEATLQALSAAADWNEFWRTLATVPGIPLSPQPAEDAFPGNIAAAAADEGFILINIDQPKPGEKLHPGATVSGAGWAIAPADIVEVGVYLDDIFLGHGRYGLPRPDVARKFPHYRHVDHCGFAFSATVPGDAVLTATTQLAITVRTESGHTGRRGVRIEPPVRAPVAPWPIRVAVEDARIDAQGMLRVNGWAVAHAGVARVALFLGERALGDAERGLDRPDVAGTHPEYADAARSGFAFSCNVADHPPGAASLRVQVIDRGGQQRPVIVPVKVPGRVASESGAAGFARGEGGTRPAEAFLTRSSDLRFECDTAHLTLASGIEIAGWALAEAGLQDISVALGDRLLGQATLGVSRSDVARRFPGEQAAARAGFAFAASAESGPFRAGDIVTITARSKANVSVPIQVPLAAPQVTAFDRARGAVRLEIDTPKLVEGQALGRVRGALTISGWAVAPDGIAAVRVLCDGTLLGDAYVGRRREDIARAFPDCEDSLRAGFALALAPGAVAEGPHHLVVIATSRGGATAESAFSITMSPADAELPGTGPRRRMPRGEIRLTEAVLSARDCHPDFTILLALPKAASDGAGWARPLARALSRTLSSLARQAYDAFNLMIVAPDSATRGVAAAAIGALTLPGRTSVVASPPRLLPAGSAPRPSLFMVLQAGDELGCDALIEFAAAYAADRARGFIYADDRRLDATRQRAEPFFKPDFAPELLLATDYIGRAWCADAALMQRAGLGLADLAGLAPYDTVLRLTEAAATVHHIDHVLAGLAATTEAAAALPALTAAAKRRGIKATAEAGRVPGTWRLKRRVTAPGLVSVIIPTAGKDGLIRRAIASLRETTAKGALEIIVLDNAPPGEKQLKAWLKSAADRVIRVPETFNWSRFNNIGAAAARGAYLLFLNDDIEAREKGWLDALLEHAQRPEVGVVGARLLYPDGKVQHAGQYLADMHARHLYRFADADDPGPFGLATVARELSAVTGACQMVRAATFKKLGGFDEAHDVVNNDLDFCLRAQREGLAVVYTPHVALMHHELASRAGIEDRYDVQRFHRDWRLAMLRGDPYHSRHLSLDDDQGEPSTEPVLPVFAGPVGPAVADIRRILAVKLDHIGDFITAVPALRDLRRRFPQARLTLLAPPATAALAQRLPGLEGVIDDIIDFTFFHARSVEGKRALAADELAALAARLADEQYDMAIDLRTHPETRPVLRHTGAAMLVGYDHDGRFPWLDVALEWEGDRRLELKRAHISERLLALVAAAEAACREVPPVTVARSADPRSVPALARLGTSFLSRPLVCVHPGVGNPVRQWPAASFAALIDLLVADEGMHVVLVGGNDEQAVAQDVLARVTAKDAVTSLVGSVKLADLAAVMQACALFVGNNSGPKHIAAAVGVPTVGIHSAVVDSLEWAPLGGAAMALQRRVVCGPCYLEFASDCPRGMACLTGIRPRDVLEHCRRALALRPPAVVVRKAGRAAA
jgi:ADP-heptose:LPS heptosyltransferase/GT2 family glycosyltransferase